MVTTTSDPSDLRYKTGSGYDGVVRVNLNSIYATGVLLYDGRAILTAAHLFHDLNHLPEIRFETSDGIQLLNTTKFLLHPDSNNDQANHDLALVWLTDSAPNSAERYALYRDTDEIGQPITLVGYGNTGTGATGAITHSQLRLKVTNQFDTEGSILKEVLGNKIAWTPQPETQLIADFDDGRSEHDAIGLLLNIKDSGTGLTEGIIAPGDSGGPAFIGPQIAGIASYVSSLEYQNIHPDIDSITNSSFGEIAAWQRISYYQQWIDQSLRAQYPDAPTRPEQVETTVTEGSLTSPYVYFLLQFHGIRTDPDQILSVDYTTQNGSALAGQDYLKAEGRLNLYPGENQAVIAVEIIDDSIAETDEYFYLSVFNPVGGSFPNDVIELTAMRTIIDNDGVIF